MCLFDIDANMRALEDLIDTCLHQTDGEMTPEVEGIISAWMEENKADLESKLEGYGAIIREKELYAKAHREEEARHAKRAGTAEALAKFLKGRLLGMFEAHGITKFQTPHFDFTVRTNGGLQPMRILVKPEELPAEYQKVTTTVTPDTLRLRAVADQGLRQDIVVLDPRGKHLLVR